MNSTSCHCFVPGCPNSQENSTNVTFHGFPEELQEEWLIAIGRSRDTFIINELVCSEHFKKNDFESYDSIRILKKNVLPTLNLPVDPKESPDITNSQVNTSSCEELQQLVEKYNSVEKSKLIKVSSNTVCTVLKPSVDKTIKYETVPLNTIKVVVVNNEFQEQPIKMSPVDEKICMSDLSDQESLGEYYLEYENKLNCRTCLSEIGPESGYLVTDVHHESKTLKEMIVYCIPRMASTLVDTDQICNKCLESVKICLNFIENCLKVEAKLLENHAMTIINESNTDCSDEDISEAYRHISLDHNYVPKIKILDEDVQDISDPAVTYDPSNTKHECSECDRTFKTKNYLLDHIRRLHSDGDKSESKKKKTCVSKCDYCDKSFLTRLGYDLHLQLSHRDQLDKKKETGSYVCKECERRFATSGHLTEHMLEEHDIIMCKICSMIFNTMKELDDHADIHPSDHLCDICGKSFKNKPYLRAHMHTHNDPNAHLCHICGRGFKSYVSLSFHIKHHNPDSKYKCDECPAAFQQRHKLNFHKKVEHLGGREYKCDVCDKKFCYKSNLSSHYRLKHSEVKPYQCEECGASFPRADYLRKHANCCEKVTSRGLASHKRKYRYKRGDPALITCKLCDKVFKDVQMLRLHVKTHTKVRKYNCNTCNLTFTTSNNRDRHEKVHEDSPFRCDVCFKKMESQEALDEHCTMTHENSKKYKCHVCQESFGRKYLLHSHVAERHRDVEDFKKEGEVLYKVVMQDYLIDE